MSPRMALAVACALVATVLAAAVPVLDEESYLDIARQLDPWRPYDWWRPWPPWGLQREADAFVYAHPPGFLIWVRAWLQQAGGSTTLIVPLKMAAGLPWAALLGWSVGRLAERMTSRPWLTVSIWLASPIVVLGLQRGLMPDLMLTSTLTCAVVAWVEGHGCKDDRGAQLRWWVGGALSLSLAVSVKYSALVMIPALALHQLALRPRPRALAFWVTLGVALVGMEAWLAVTYGRVHLFEVLTRADEIGHSPFSARVLGVATRLGLGMLFLPLLARPFRRVWPVVVLAALGIVWLGVPDGTSSSGVVSLAVGAAVGLGLLSLAARELLSPRAPKADRTPADGVLLGGWAVAVILGVAFGHNFAAPRYLLPAMAPLAVIFGRVCGSRLDLRSLAWTGALVSAGVALVWSWSEHRFFDAADAAARSVVLAHPEGGCFIGEWSFRHHLQEAGWTFCGTLADMQDLPSGSVIAAPVHSSPGELPEGLVPGHTAAFGWSPIRLVDAPEGVAWYGESLGAQPVSWHPGPLEQVATWTVP